MSDDDITPKEEASVPSQGATLLDSRTGQLNDLLLSKLENAFHKQTSHVVLHDLAKIAIEHDPIDLAHAVTHLPLSVRHIVYENLPDLQAKMIFMINVGPNTRVAIFRYLSDEEITKLIEAMPPDEAVSVIEDLADRRRKRVLEGLNAKKASRIRELQKHGRYTAGRLMTNEFFAFPMDTTIGRVAMFVRDNPGIELNRSIFVLNGEGELIGFVPLRNIIVNTPHVPLRQVMRPVLHTVSPDAPRDEVVDIVERYKTGELPVVDEKNKLLGVINYEDVVEVMEDLADETIASMAGTAEKVSEYEPTYKRFLWRAPWLLVTLCAGLITATGLSYFQSRPWYSIIPFFVPLIAGMSGNVGMQCSTIFVRGMATGEISPGTRRETIARELTIGHIIGIVFGLLSGSIVYLFSKIGIQTFSNVEPLLAGVVVCAGIFGACFTATILGTFSPLMFARLRIDPAVSSGPIVTAFNDVLSTFMYILIVKLVSTHFGM